MNSLTIHRGNATLAYKTFLFPDGCVGFRLDHDNHRFRAGRSLVPPFETESITIVARIRSSEDVMELVMATDALRRWTENEIPLKLVLPCCPYQRDDRVCVPGNAFSLKAFAALINGLQFARVTVFDPHSDCVGAVFDRIEIVTQREIIGRFDALNARLQPPVGEKPFLCSPDAGANKRVGALAAHYGHSTFIRGDKTRDLATGKLTGFKVYVEPGELDGRDVIMVDDLADGGLTFTGLAAELKAKGARRVELYVTHAILSKGLAPLLDGGIDHIWTSNSFRTDIPHQFPFVAHAKDRVTILDIESVFSL